MAWNYDYRLGPEGGTLIVLSTICESARILGDGAGTGLEGDDADVQYLHGERVNPEKYSASGQIMLELTFRDTDSAGAVTHADGRPGHIYENIAIAKKAFYAPRTRVTLQRIAPHQGTVRVNGQVVQAEMIGEVEWRTIIPIKVADPPFWESTTLVSAVNPVPTLVVAGNAPVDDVLVTVSDGTCELTHTASGRIVGLSGAATGGTINCRLGTAFNGSTDLSEWLVRSHPNFMELDGGETNAFSVSGGTATVTYRPKWRL